LPIGAKEPRAEKVEAVARLKTALDVATVILADYQGLNVKEISDLRSKLREAGCGCTVVKNTLFRLAVTDTNAAPLAEGLAGPTAVVFTDDDPVGAAKVLQGFAKAVKPIKVKSGMVDGNLCSAEQIEALSKIPPKQELYAMLVGGLQSPITGLVGTLQSMMAQLVMTLQAVAEKQQAAA
jgi:large subunit ribosomal protein L10